MSNRLAIIVLPPDRSAWDWLETRPVVDGRDLVADAGFTVGPAEDPDLLLGRGSPLLPADLAGTARKVRLAVAECDEFCCGALYLHVWREGDEIVWDRWIDTSRSTAPSFGAFRFDAAAYEAELGRADRERDWEWPGRTLARLLRGLLERYPEILPGRWETSNDAVYAPWRQPDQVEIRALDGSVLTSLTASTAEPFDEQAEQALHHLETARPGAEAKAGPGTGPGDGS